MLLSFTKSCAASSQFVSVELVVARAKHGVAAHSEKVSSAHKAPRTTRMPCALFLPVLLNTLPVVAVLFENVLFMKIV